MRIIKPPMYRRGSKGNGVRERAFWALSKGPATATELAKRLKVKRESIVSCLSENKSGRENVADVSFVFVTNSDGKSDRLYTLNGKVRRVTSKVTPQKTIVVSMKSLSERGEDKKLAAEKAAAARRRLIASGLYITESDLI